MPLPTPKKGENKDSFISRCVKFVKDENPRMPNDQAVAMCMTQFDRKKKKKKKENFKKLNNRLSVAVPISESFRRNGEGDLVIQGVAINNTTTRNGVFYSEEELRKAAKTLSNVPILKDHTNSVDTIVGRTTRGFFDTANKRVMFEGIIKDKEMIEKIEKGLITAVSVGAYVKDLKEMRDEEGNFIGIFEATGIEFVEISLVAVPADPEAGFDKAIAEMLQEQNNDNDNDNDEEENINEEEDKEREREEEKAKVEIKDTNKIIKQKQKIKKSYSFTVSLGEKISIAIPKRK